MKKCSFIVCAALLLMLGACNNNPNQDRDSWADTGVAPMDNRGMYPDESYNQNQTIDGNPDTTSIYGSGDTERVGNRNPR